MKNKKLLTVLFVAVILVVCVFAIQMVFTGAAEEVTELSIARKNLAFKDAICIKYAVDSDDPNVKLLIWNTPQTEYKIGTQHAKLESVGNMTIDGKVYKIFDLTGMSAKKMTDVVYARAYVNSNGVDVYSKVEKYSVLQYAYNKLGKTGTADPGMYEILNDMLAYGATAQKYFSYSADRLANDDWYQVKLTEGWLDDTCDNGLYLEGDSITLNAPETDISGNAFGYWVDSNGNNVGETAKLTLTVGAKNEKYTPIYESNVEFSDGLEFESNGDGTCIVLGMGDFTGSELVIPATSPEGDTVTEIDASAFAGEDIITVRFPNTITYIGRKAFNGCASITDVYYDGTEEEWINNVEISTYNAPLENATMHFKIAAVTTYTVTFVDYDGTELKKETVEEGKNATAPSAPTREGYTFVGWDKSFNNVSADLVVTAKYTKLDTTTYTVTFVDYDGSTLATRTVNAGGDATPPANPTKNGVTFLGWTGNYANVTKDETVRAVYSDEKNVIVAHSVSGTAGGNATVLFEITGNVKVCGFDFALFYDPALEIESYDNDLDLDVVFNEAAYENGSLLNYSGTSDKVKQRDIIEITFKISDSATGMLPINMVMNSIKELNSNDIYIDTEYVLVNGVVTVE